MKAIEPNTMLLTLDKEWFLSCLADENARAMSEKIRVLRHIRAFKDMRDGALQKISERCMLRSYPAGQGSAMVPFLFVLFHSL